MRYVSGSRTLILVDHLAQVWEPFVHMLRVVGHTPQLSTLRTAYWVFVWQHCRYFSEPLLAK